MSCLARVGCMLLIVAAGVAAFLTRDRWLHRAPLEPVATTTDWVSLDEKGAVRARDALARLSSPSGPVFATLSASDVASYAFLQLAKRMPAPSDSLSARVNQDRVAIRASVKTSDLGSSVAGVLGALLGDRERVEVSGTLRVISPGLAEFRVSDAKIRGIDLPDAVIERLIAPAVKGPRPKGLDENAVPVSIPAYIGDVRVANGKITLYKNVQ